MENFINICISCDDNYAKHAGVLIASILYNAKNSDMLAFHILDGGISEQNKQQIISLKSIKDCQINFIPIDEKLFEEYKNVKSHKYITLATYYRLKLPSLLPDISKVIYLDCDMVVLTSLFNLFNKNINNCPIAGVHDIKSKNVKKNPTYVNAGMLVMDLEKMRELKTEENFLTWTKEHIETITVGDQEIINEVCKDNIFILDDSWNVQSSNFANRSSYTKYPKIVHFTARLKPWHWASLSYHRDLYFKYLQMTPWKLSDEEFKHWTKDNQKASILAYLKYRPLFFIRPKFYEAIYYTYFRTFTSSIFSISKYNETHNILKILGFRIKFAKAIFAKKLKENPYYYYKEHNVDIRTIPSATGQLRDIQLANLEILKELDYVCKKTGMQYWIDGGTLLGAVRHKGFIPWDDDIDVAMLRQDYENFITIFNNNTRNPDLFADYERKEKLPTLYIIKVQHRKCKHLFVDIFPWDIYGKRLTEPEQINETLRIKSIIERIKKNHNLKTPNKELKQILTNTMNNEIISKENQENSDYVWGIDYPHIWKNWFTHYEVLNPLKTIEFEGMEFPCLNNPDAFLSRLYGNYMDYPKKIGFGHSAYKELTEEEINVIKNLQRGINER